MFTKLILTPAVCLALAWGLTQLLSVKVAAPNPLFQSEALPLILVLLVVLGGAILVLIALYKFLFNLWER